VFCRCYDYAFRRCFTGVCFVCVMIMHSEGVLVVCVLLVLWIMYIEGVMVVCVRYGDVCLLVSG
jgi:uncharacterized membrane protein YdbT with pleckstrin-like domain